MSRFSMNRHWTLIFALGVCLATSAIAYDSVTADPLQEVVGDPGGGGVIGPTGVGDPDVPDGSGRYKSIKSGAQGRGNMSTESRVVGDDVVSRGWMGRLNVAWIGLRSFWFRF